MPITALDGLLIFVTFLSAALAMYRGFVREVLSIISWLAATVVAYFFYPALLPYAGEYIENDMLAIAACALLIFLVTLTIVSYITVRISDFVSESRIGALDRSLGFVFGACRGVLIVVAALLVFGWFVPDNRQPEWIAQAKSKPVLQSLGGHLIALLPNNPEHAILGIDALDEPAESVPSSHQRDDSVQAGEMPLAAKDRDALDAFLADQDERS